MSQRLVVFLRIVKSICIHMSSPLQHGQWHMAAQLLQALVFQLSPELMQWVGGGVRIRGLGRDKREEDADCKHMESVCSYDNVCIKIQRQYRLTLVWIIQRRRVLVCEGERESLYHEGRR